MAKGKNVSMMDVAHEAGVSIASVSATINNSRYVSSKIRKRVWDAIKSTGYSYASRKAEFSADNFRKEAYYLAFAVPNNKISFLNALFDHLETNLDPGTDIKIFYHKDNPYIEKKLSRAFLQDKSCISFFYYLTNDKISESGLDQLSQKNGLIVVEGQSEIQYENLAVIDIGSMVKQAADVLFKNGHIRIGLIMKKRKNFKNNERYLSFSESMHAHGININSKWVLCFDESFDWKSEIQYFINSMKLSALIFAEFTDSMKLFKSIARSSLSCPEDVSLIFLDNPDWFEIVDPPITSVALNHKEFNKFCEIKLKQLISLSSSKELPKAGRKANNLTKKHLPEKIFSPKVFMRKSTQMKVNGPFGEKAFSPSDIYFTEKDRKLLLKQHYKAGISFHYGEQRAWYKYHEKGIRESLYSLGIEITDIENAQFNPYIQIRQINKIMRKKPDILISIPTNDELLSALYRKISGSTKLIFISNVPKGLGLNEYYSCISVNERENGTNIGRYIQQFYNSRKVNFAILSHGQPFYGTQLRDGIVSQILMDESPNINVISRKNFYRIENAYQSTKNICILHPDLEGIYVSWEAAALAAIRALDELGMYDVDVFTCDLDLEIAVLLAKGHHVRAISSQRPYEQGVAIGNATGKALLGDSKYKYIGVPSYLIDNDNLYSSWRAIFHSDLPISLRTLNKNMRKYRPT